MKQSTPSGAPAPSAALARGAKATLSPTAVRAGGNGAAAGSVRIVETPYGPAIEPALTGLAPGLHGCHMQESTPRAPGDQGGAAAAAIVAGPRPDPAPTEKHGQQPPGGAAARAACGVVPAR